MAQMRADLARRGISLTWQGFGSTEAKQRYASGQVDLAETELPFQPGEPTGPPFVYTPSTATGVSLMYNLGPTTSLQLSPETLAKIYTCQITSWGHPAIVTENPGLDLGTGGITPVARFDTSVSSLRFTEYLASQAPGLYTGPVTATSPFDNSSCVTSSALSDGVANFVHTRGGTIGYVET